MKKLSYLFVVFMCLFTTTTHATISDADTIYLLASSDNVSGIESQISIDATDKNGNTALCKAVKADNVNAYLTLVKAGANTEHKCIKKISDGQYQTFMQKVTAANKSWSFLGLGKWAWGGIGAAAVGGAVAMSGGSSTSNPNNTPDTGPEISCEEQGYNYIASEPCPNGWTEAGYTCSSGGVTYKKCTPNQCVGYQMSCGTGYEEIAGDTCLAGDVLMVKCTQKACDGYDFTNVTQCPRGYDLGSSCQSGETIMYKCDTPADCSDFDYNNSSQCPAGYTIGSSCLSGATTTYKCDALIQCPYHTIECVGGYVATGNTCQSGESIYKECKPVQCKEDEIWSEQGCITSDNIGMSANSAILFNNDTMALVYNQNDVADFYGIQNTAASSTNPETYNAYSYTGPDATDFAYDTASISIVNNSNANVYGIYGNGKVINAYAKSELGSFTSEAYGAIYIDNNGDGDVYGLYGDDVLNAYAHRINEEDSDIHILPIANGTIVINNHGDGDVYGMYGNKTAYNSDHSGSYPDSETKGFMHIINRGNGDVYGIKSRLATNGYAYTERFNHEPVGIIKIQNFGTGITYGIYGESLSQNHTEAETSIINQSTGIGIGLYSSGYFATSSWFMGGSVHNNGKTNLQNMSSGKIVGAVVLDEGVGRNAYGATINLNNIGTGSVIGMLGGAESDLENSSSAHINITRNAYLDEYGVAHEPTSDTAGIIIGMFADENSTVENSGDINITTNGNAFGIYAKTGSHVINSGNINITADGTAYGIYVEGDSTVSNTGQISINGAACSDRYCYTGNYIVLNGSTLVNAGTMSADTLSLNSMGGTVRAAAGSRFVATDAISGDLNISSELVSSGNQTTYVAENMIDAGDVSGLNLVSESALFNARLSSNGHDVVMTMRGFDEFTDNKSLAAFLAHNYATGNNTDLFGDLKSIGTNAAFMGALNGFSGLGAFNQFANEDLAAMREMNFSMNEQLFETSGRDDVDISGGVNYFSFSNQSGVGSGSYGLSIDRISDKWKIGYGMSMANISTGNDDGINRQNTIGLFYMPMTYTNSGYEVIVNPKIGFSRGEYNRQGFNNMSYEGYIEKRIFGLMNDIRYPLTFGNWTVAPNLGLNAIVYNQSGHEENKMYGLIIPDSNLVSVEAGLGLYAKYDRTFADNSKLSFNTGLMAYREFGDCYNIKLGIRGMDGTFDLYDNNLYDYRGAATIGFKYNSGRLNLYGNAQYFTDSDSYMNLKAGIRFAF